METIESGPQNTEQPPFDSKPPSEDCVGSIRGEVAVSLDGVKTTLKTKRAKVKHPAHPETNGSILSSLPPKHQLFVQAYADNNSPTFGNGVQSALSAGIGNNNYPAAGTSAHELLKTGEIRSAVSEMLNKAGIGKEVRSEIIAKLAKKEKMEILHYDAGGNIRERQVVDNDGARLKAVALAAKIDGDYDRAREGAHLQARAAQPLFDYWAKRIRAELSLPHNAPPGADSEPTVNATQDSGQQDAIEGESTTGAAAGESNVTLPVQALPGDGGAGG